MRYFQIFVGRTRDGNRPPFTICVKTQKTVLNLIEVPTIAYVIGTLLTREELAMANTVEEFYAGDARDNSECVEV